MLSCNNEPKKVSEVNTGSATMDPPGDASQTKGSAFNGNFPYLAMPKKTLDSLFDKPVKSKKVVFTFQFDDYQTSPSLVAYGIKKKIFLANTPQYKLLKLGLTNNLPGEFYLSNLELTDNQYAALQANGGYESSSYLLFYPKFSTTYPKSINYQVQWGNLTMALTDTIQTFLSPEDLNPSPPAKPSDDN